MDHDTASPAIPPIAARLAPFVAWLASQEPDERTRRDFRTAVEGYLGFQTTDGGQPESRASRYLASHPDVHPEILRSALAKLAEHDEVVRLTLPMDR